MSSDNNDIRAPGVMDLNPSILLHAVLLYIANLSWLARQML